jgi:hypothetical protein
VSRKLEKSRSPITWREPVNRVGILVVAGMMIVEDVGGGWEVGRLWCETRRPTMDH